MRPLFWCLLLLDAAAATSAQTVQSAPASPAQVGAASNISQSNVPARAEPGGPLLTWATRPDCGKFGLDTAFP